MNDVNTTCLSDTVMLFLVHWEFYLRRSLIPRYLLFYLNACNRNFVDSWQNQTLVTPREILLAHHFMNNSTLSI